MMNNDLQNSTDDMFDDMLGGLEQIAGRLKVQRFPGRAWTAPVRNGVGRGDWRRTLLRWGVPLTAAAAVIIVALGVRFFQAPRQQVALQPPTESLSASLSQEIARFEPAQPTQAPLDEDAFFREPFVSYPFEAISAEDGLSELVIVEDFDSYSIIDLTTGVPFISFVRKDSYDLTDVMPAFSAPAEAADDSI